MTTELAETKRENKSVFQADGNRNLAVSGVIGGVIGASKAFLARLASKTELRKLQAPSSKLQAFISNASFSWKSDERRGWPACANMRQLARQGLLRLSNHPRQWAAFDPRTRPLPGRRRLTIQATPSTDSSTIVIDTNTTSASSPDATFEILGSPSSLLSVSLSPSQDLYTRRGTLIGLSSSGDPSSTISTLRLLSPLRRAFVGIPFLYQKITSPSPVTALVSSKSPLTSFCVLQLDGTTDWRLSQRKSLLAWTGSTLTVTPTISPSLSVTNWGTSTATGRGLLALVGSGQIFSLQLGPGETYIAHPSNVLAYSLSSSNAAPTPYRFKSSSVNLQVPIVFGNFFPSSKFVQNVKKGETYKFFAGIAYRVRTWSRRTIWGDRLFLQFTGPTTLLVQSRGARISDVLTTREVNEIADAPPGVVREAIESVSNGGSRIKGGSDASRTGVEGATISASTAGAARKEPRLSYASVSRDGKVKIEETKSFSQSR